MEDTAEKQSLNESQILTTVNSGKSCKLVGIINPHQSPRRRRQHRGRMRDAEPRRKHIHLHGESYAETGEGFGRLRVLRRLLDLGITKGCSFKIIHASTAGPILVEVRGTRVAIGQGLARKMAVKVVES